MTSLGGFLMRHLHWKVVNRSDPRKPEGPLAGSDFMKRYRSKVMEGRRED